MQAVKAISGGVIALKGQLLKGSGYLVATKGRMLTKAGDAVTNLGRNIAKSVYATPQPAYPVYSYHHHLEGEFHLQFERESFANGKVSFKFANNTRADVYTVDVK